MITSLAQALQEDFPRWEGIHAGLDRRPHHKGVNAGHRPAFAISMFPTIVQPNVVQCSGKAQLHQWVHADDHMLVVRLHTTH